MPRRKPSPEESAADPQLVLNFFVATKKFFPAMVPEASTQELLGLTKAGMKKAVRLGYLVPSHPGVGKGRQYALVNVVKMFFDGAALIEAAHAGVEFVADKNEKAKLARLNKATPHESAPA